MSLDIRDTTDGQIAVTLASLVPDLRERAAVLDRATWELLAYAGHKPGYVLTAMADGLAVLLGEDSPDAELIVHVIEEPGS